LNHSPQIPLPPILSCPVEAMMLPVWARVATWVPFTKNLCVAPSYVVARCVQLLFGTVEVPATSRSPPM
jgi:hypothetical protein